MEAYRRYGRGDVDGALALGHEDVTLRPFYEPALSSEGRESVRAVFESHHDPRIRWRAEDLTCREVGEYVLVAGRLETVSALGSPLEFPVAWLFTTREAQIASMVAYPSADDALQAARLER
jgi:ketosteroid isomerase-like protein